MNLSLVDKRLYDDDGNCAVGVEIERAALTREWIFAIGTHQP